MHHRSVGPSPRAWGEPARNSIGNAAQRTIPTRVGRTFREYDMNAAVADHPHARGENSRRGVIWGQTRGPSPRAWGEPLPRRVFRETGRTIPTRVGRTAMSDSRESKKPDHPHARGENFKKRMSLTEARGPSPRAWGERRAARIRSHSSWTIPTRVGRTRRTAPDRRRLTDHPHARGENNIHRPVYPTTRGPSPRAWGELGGGC